MRTQRAREKLTLEEKFALALDLIKRERSLDEIRLHYRVSHTTAYKIRNAFLQGGRSALSGERRQQHERDLEARIRALEAAVGDGLGGPTRKLKRIKTAAMRMGNGGDLLPVPRPSGRLEQE
jgi:hypothetical protein